MRGLFKLFGMFLLERPKLVDGVERRLLYADPGIEIRERKNVFLNFGVGAGRAAVAIRDSVRTEIQIIVEKNEIDAPRIDAYGLDRAFGEGDVDPLLDRRH